MTSKQITSLIRQTVSNTIYEIFSDPDLGKEVRKPFLRSLENARNSRKGSLTLAQFRKQYAL